LWQGDTDTTGNPINLVVPRASAGVDPFLNIITATQKAGMKVQVYLNSSNMLERGAELNNPASFPNITERWKEWVDNNEEAQAFITSQPYHDDVDYPNRKYMFAYAEFVLKTYAIRYGTLIDAWLFDSGSFMKENGDNATNGVKEDQKLFGAWADAARAGNPNAAVSFNNSPERDTEALNPFSEGTHYDDYMFGHPYNGGRYLGNHDNGIYERNYAHIEKITATNGNVHSGSVAEGSDAHDWDWDDKVVGHFDPPMSRTRWNSGAEPGLTDDEFVQWNLESARGGGAISWGAPLLSPPGSGVQHTLQPWAMAQLELMDASLTVNQTPGAPNWARAHTYLEDAFFSQTYTRKLVEGTDFWDPEGDAITLTLIADGAPSWLTLVQDELNPGTWLLQGTTTEEVAADYEFVIQASDESGTTERVFNLTVTEYVEPEVPEVPEEPAAPLLTKIFATADIDYGVDTLATLVSDVQTAADGVATFQIAIDVTPVAGGNVVSKSSGGSSTSQSWGITDGIFRGNLGDEVESINNIRITNFNANGSCLALSDLSHLSFDNVGISNGQSAQDRVKVTSNGLVNNESGVKMMGISVQYDLVWARDTAITEVALANGTTSATNKWSVDYLEVSYLVTEPVVVEGDFDCAGVLGTSDMVIFRTALGSELGDDAYVVDADLDNDGVVTRYDYTQWFMLYRNQQAAKSHNF